MHKLVSRRWLPLLFLLAASLSGAADKAKKLEVGVSLLTQTNPFFKDLGEAMKQEGLKYNMQVVVVSGEFDAARQRNQVSDFIVKKCAAIVLSPCDSKAVGTAISQANKAGIPVFTVDIASMASEGKVISHVATDNLGGGRLAAQAMIEALHGKGKVAILDHPEVESVLLRTKGFEEELNRQKKEKGVGIEVVAKLPGADPSTNCRIISAGLDAPPVCWECRRQSG
jgi:ribose transport system substrate-binding protein